MLLPSGASGGAWRGDDAGYKYGAGSHLAPTMATLRTNNGSRARVRWLDGSSLPDTSEHLIIGPAARAPSRQPVGSVSRVSNPLMKATRFSSSRLSEALSDRLSAPEVVVLAASPNENSQHAWLRAGAVVAFRPPGADLNGNLFDSSCPGVLLYPPDSSGEAQIRWAGGELSGWIHVTHLHPASETETLAVEMLQECEPIVWLHTELCSVSPHGHKKLYVTWRNKHSRRVLCVSEGSRVSPAFLITNNLAAKEGILTSGDGRCATAELTPGRENATVLAPADVVVRMRWPCGMKSSGVCLASLDFSSAPEIRAEADAWKEYAAHLELERSPYFEWKDVWRSSLVIGATVANWVATLTCQFFASDKTASTVYFWVSLGLHVAVGCTFVAILTLSRVKGMHIHPVVASAFAAAVGMLGAASVAFVLATATFRRAASSDKANAAWLHRISLAGTVPHAVLNVFVLLRLPAISSPANACAVAATIMCIALDQAYGLVRLVACCQVVRPHRRLLLIAASNASNTPTYVSGQADASSYQVAVIYWHGRKVATLKSQPPTQLSSECRPRDSPTTYWHQVVQVNIMHSCSCELQVYSISTEHMCLDSPTKAGLPCAIDANAQLDDILDTNDQEISTTLRIEVFQGSAISTSSPPPHLALHAGNNKALTATTGALGTRAASRVAASRQCYL